MSTIALVSGDTGHATVTQTTNLLTGIGHSVTVFDQSALAVSTNFDAFDLICTVRLLSTEYVADGDAIKNLLAGDKPMLLAMMQGGSSSTGVPMDNALVRASLIGSYEQVGGSASGLLIFDNTHPITDAYSVSATLAVNSSSTWGSGLDESNTTHVGERLGNNPTSGRGNLFAIERGSLTLDSAVTIGSRVVIADYIYGATGYGADAPALTTAVIDWLLEPPAPAFTLGQRWPRAVSGAGSSLRNQAEHSTAILASGASEEGTISLSASYRLLKIQTNRPARVRLYASAAYQTADASRPIGTDPAGDHGLMFEFITTGSLLSAFLTPLVDGSSESGVVDIPITVTNRDASSGAVSVTLDYIRTE